MEFGYIRVSTRMQNVERQILALGNECDELFIDRISGRKKKRPELDRMMKMLREGDTIKVLRLSRFGRSGKDLAALADEILAKGATLISKKEGFRLDGSPMGKMLYSIMAALSEFEADIIRERTMEGLRAAAAQGRVGGRPKGLSDDAKRVAKLVAQTYQNTDWSVRTIAKDFGISPTTLYSYLKHEGVKTGKRFTKTPKRSG